MGCCLPSLCTRRPYREIAFHLTTAIGVAGNGAWRGPNDHKLNGPAPYRGYRLEGCGRKEYACIRHIVCIRAAVRPTNTKLRAVDASAAAPSTSRARQSVASKLFFTLAVFVWIECGRGGPASGGSDDELEEM